MGIVSVHVDIYVKAGWPANGDGDWRLEMAWCGGPGKEGFSDRLSRVQRPLDAMFVSCQGCARYYFRRDNITSSRPGTSFLPSGNTKLFARKSTNMVFNKTKALLMPLALFGAVTNASTTTTADEGKNNSLLRKRTEAATPKARTNGDLWDEVAAKAELDKEADSMYRELQRFSIVTPSAPTLPPALLPTLSPVSCGGQSRELYLKQVFSQLTPVNIIENRLTPQGRAFEWMSLFDEYMASPCNRNAGQRYALLTLYYATNGENWTKKARWLTGQTECNWQGVECNKGVVTHLKLGTFENPTENSMLQRYNSSLTKQTSLHF